MPRPSSLTRRELIALAGVGAGILILGEGVLASEAMSGPASLARAGSSESCDSTEAGVTENPKAAASERSPEDAAASPEEVADSAAKASMAKQDSRLPVDREEWQNYEAFIKDTLKEAKAKELLGRARGDYLLFGALLYLLRVGAK